jgi:hypothetical protein
MFGLTKETTDPTAIIAGLDEECDRNTALQAYLFALRDLQILHNESAYEPIPDAEFDVAYHRVRDSMTNLVLAERALNGGS